MKKLKLTVGRQSLEVELLDTPTANALFSAAPFESRVTTWGDEVYFPAPVKVEREDDARDVVEAGELAFRVEGEVVIIGYGPTPVSEGDEIRLALPANVWGRTHDDVQQLRKVEPGQLIRVEAL